MSLLDNLPDECSIIQRVQDISQETNPLGGRKEADHVIQRGVSCWVQQASSSEVIQFGKRGMTITHKVFFSENPLVGAGHKIKATKRGGTSLSSPQAFDVISTPDPDASAGLGHVWRVMVRDETGSR